MCSTVGYFYESHYVGLVKIQEMSRTKKISVSAIFTAYVRLIVEVTFVKNWSNWSSGVEIQRDT